jgi:hypothetical protein
MKWRISLRQMLKNYLSYDELKNLSGSSIGSKGGLMMDDSDLFIKIFEFGGDCPGRNKKFKSISKVEMPNRSYQYILKWYPRSCL